MAETDTLCFTGQLPFLVHGTEVVTSFASILKYVSGLAETEGNKYPNANTDKHLSPKERSQRNAWLAHVEANHALPARFETCG